MTCDPEWWSGSHPVSAMGEHKKVSLRIAGARGFDLMGVRRRVLHRVVDIFATTLPEPEARQRALALVAMCLGALVAARVVGDPGLGDKFRDAAREHLLVTTGSGDPRTAPGV